MTPPRISFEFFPPHDIAGAFRLSDTVRELAPLEPGVVSVTDGAGGPTRPRTHHAVTTRPEPHRPKVDAPRHGGVHVGVLHRCMRRALPKHGADGVKRGPTAQHCRGG